MCPASFLTASFLLRFEPMASELTVLQMRCTVRKGLESFKILLASPTYFPVSQKHLENIDRCQAYLLSEMELIMC